MAGSLNRAVDFRLGGAVRTHRIQGYGAWHCVRVGGLAGLLDLDYFAALIVTALGANTMRHLPLMAIWALGERVLG